MNKMKILLTYIYHTTGSTGFEFLVDSSSPMHYPSLSLSKPWESYRLRVLPSAMAASQSANVTSLPYINTVAPVSNESVSLYASSQSVSLPGTGGTVSDVRSLSEIKVSYCCLSSYKLCKA